MYCRVWHADPGPERFSWMRLYPKPLLLHVVRSLKRLWAPDSPTLTATTAMCGAMLHPCLTLSRCWVLGGTMGAGLLGAWAQGLWREGMRATRRPRGPGATGPPATGISKGTHDKLMERRRKDELIGEIRCRGAGHRAHYGCEGNLESGTTGGTWGFLRVERVRNGYCRLAGGLALSASVKPFHISLLFLRPLSGRVRPPGHFSLFPPVLVHYLAILVLWAISWPFGPKVVQKCKKYQPGSCDGAARALLGPCTFHVPNGVQTDIYTLRSTSCGDWIAKGDRLISLSAGFGGPRCCLP